VVADQVLPAETPDVVAQDIEVPETPLSEVEPVPLARCQWCAEQFDDRLLNCPACGVVHRLASPVCEGAAAPVCQWCQTAFEPGADNCPECGAMAIVPGQYVIGQNDPLPLYASQSLLNQRAQSHQLLVGMIAGGGLDSLFAGLIGLAITLFDDD
jgi:hypothetical protein